jgi:hypothetical protein
MGRKRYSMLYKNKLPALFWSRDIFFQSPFCSVCNESAIAPCSASGNLVHLDSIPLIEAVRLDEFLCWIRCRFRTIRDMLEKTRIDDGDKTVMESGISLMV